MGGLFGFGPPPAATRRDVRDDGGWKDAFAKIDIRRVVAGAAQTRRAKEKARADRLKEQSRQAEKVWEKVKRDIASIKTVTPDERRSRELSMVLLKKFPAVAAQIASSKKSDTEKVEALNNYFGPVLPAKDEPSGLRITVSLRGPVFTGKGRQETVRWDDFIATAANTVAGPERPSWMLPVEKLAAWKREQERKKLSEHRKLKARIKADARWLKKRQSKTLMGRAEAERRYAKVAPIMAANEEWLKRVSKIASDCIQKAMSRKAEGDEVAALINRALLDRRLIRDEKSQFVREGWVQQTLDAGSGKFTRRVNFESVPEKLIPGAQIDLTKKEKSGEEEET